MVEVEGRRHRWHSLPPKLRTLDCTALEGVMGKKHHTQPDRQARANLPKSAQSDGKVTDSGALAKSGRVRTCSAATHPSPRHGPSDEPGSRRGALGKRMSDGKPAAARTLHPALFIPVSPTHPILVRLLLNHTGAAADGS